MHTRTLAIALVFATALTACAKDEAAPTVEKPTAAAAVTCDGNYPGGKVPKECERPSLKQSEVKRTKGKTY